jgi:nuclear pore complex protein Nup133
MALDQYGGFGMGAPVPRRIYALVRLGASTKRGEVAKFEGGSGDGGVIEGIGGGMKIDGVTGVPYATVRLCLASALCVRSS